MKYEKIFAVFLIMDAIQPAGVVEFGRFAFISMLAMARPMTMKIAIAGAGGRMGRELARIVNDTEGCVLAGGLEAKGSTYVGMDYGTLFGVPTLGVTITDDVASLLPHVDGIIDFTVPVATLALAQHTAALGKVHVIGTTGLDAPGESAIAAAAQKTRVVKTGNFSLGINLLQGIVRKVAEVLGNDFDIEVLEMHHRHKIDAPSGTALMLGKAAADGRKVDLATKSVRSRDGHTGARNPGDIGFATLRGGSVVGDHTVMFASDAERIELTHKAQSREMFARGAVRAALWAFNQKPGLYDMQHVLGLR
jgi:4-hydroxy-tetrahydrodipicolinate reductase